MTPLTAEERLYEAALAYIGAGPDEKSIESRKCRLLGNIGPEGQGFGPAFRTAAGLDSDTAVPEKSKSVQAWALWGHFVETKDARQGDTVVTEDFVGVVDCVRGDTVVAIGFQDGSVRMAKVPRSLAMIRRSVPPVAAPEPQPKTATVDSGNLPPPPVIPVVPTPGLKQDGTPKKKPGRKPKAEVAA